MGWTTTGFFVADMLIRVILALRVIMLRRPVGVSLSWLAIIMLFPFLGGIIYLFVGENRLGLRRARRANELLAPYLQWFQALGEEEPVQWAQIFPACEPLNKHANKTVGIPALPGNHLDLFTTCHETFESLAHDIETARQSVYMEFYIWEEGGETNRIAEALGAAAQRGVDCRVLLDAVGSAPFLRGKTVAQLRQQGVQVEEALPVGLFRMLFVRLDLRLHRKIVVIDGEVGYTGSMNLADARLFGKRRGIGPWVDVMARIHGPAVSVLEAVFFWDWELDTNVGLHAVRRIDSLPKIPHQGQSIVQVVPSGPGYASNAIHQLLLNAMYLARSELIMTTPYFVPDEAMMTALVSAAHRGVKTTLVLPAKNNHPLVELASRSYFEELLTAGIHIVRFQGGLLHSKTMTVDGEIALVGSVNMDIRSFWLNFEITLFVYNHYFGSGLREIQQQYIQNSDPVNLIEWYRRPATHRFFENLAQLFGPVL